MNDSGEDRRAPVAKFGKNRRLRKQVDFQRVYSLKQAASDRFLLIFAARNELGQTRLGLSVSRKVGPAVRRNRWKRLLREAFRTQLHLIPGGLDIIVIPRGPTLPALASLRRSLWELTQRLDRQLPRNSNL